MAGSDSSQLFFMKLTQLTILKVDGKQLQAYFPMQCQTHQSPTRWVWQTGGWLSSDMSDACHKMHQHMMPSKRLLNCSPTPHQTSVGAESQVDDEADGWVVLTRTCSSLHKRPWTVADDCEGWRVQEAMDSGWRLWRMESAWTVADDCKGWRVHGQWLMIVKDGEHKRPWTVAEDCEGWRAQEAMDSGWWLWRMESATVHRRPRILMTMTNHYSPLLSVVLLSATHHYVTTYCELLLAGQRQKYTSRSTILRLLHQSACLA